MPEIQARPERPSILGAIDIGGTKVAAAIVAADGRIIARRSSPTPVRCDHRQIIAFLADLLRSCACDADEPIKAIGIGSTGPVNPCDGTVGDVALLPGWRGLDLVGALADAFQADVALENDADAGALAEWRWGTGRGTKRFVYVTISTGIGSGLIIDGKLYRGAGGAHPEMGHHSIEASGPPCYCGSTGCWESLASGPALAAFGQSLIGADQDGAPDCRAFFDQARLGDRIGIEVAKRASNYIGIGIANIITTLSPDVIALGGGVMESHDLILPAALAIARQRCGLVPFDQTRVVRAGLGVDTPLLGAAAVWLSRHVHLAE